MGFFLELKNYLRKGSDLSPESESAVSSWNLLGLSRTDTRIRYNDESAFKAYRSHELVFSCINKIADVMNDAEIIVEVKNAKNEWERKDGHMLPALFKRPNSYQTGRDVRKMMVQSEQGLGKFYAHIERSGAGIPVSMTILNPNRVVPFYDQSRTEILYYEYLAANGKRIPLKKEDLFIRRRSDLLDQFNGYAPLMAALKSINSDLGLTDYVDAFFESDGTPSGILKILNSTIKDTKKEEIAALWKKKYGRGGSNQKGVAVLDQNADFQKIGSNLDELASDSLSGRFESRICSVFGVPPILVGAYVGLLHTTNNATAKAGLQDFWDNKISNELAGFREWLTWFVLPEFEDIANIQAEKIRVSFDISHVAYLQEDVEKAHQRARDNFKAGGWTLNEFREATGKQPDPNGDYYLQPQTLAALSPENRALEAFEKVEVGTNPNDPQGSNTDSQDTQNDPNTDPQDEEKPKALATPEKKTFEIDGITLGREPRGAEVFIDFKKIVGDYESEKEKCIKVLSKFRVELIDQAVSTLDKLTTETAHTLTLTPNPKRRKEIANALKSAYQTGREQIVAEITAQQNSKGSLFIEFQKAESDYLDYLDELTDGLISRIINEITARAVNEYLSLKLLNDYLAEKLSETLLAQAEKYIDKMAGSVVNAAINTGREDELRANVDQVEFYQYSALLDKNTCSPCADADGLEAANIDDLPSAPNPDCDGGENCRCLIVGVVV